MKLVNLQIQSESEELKQYGWPLCLRIERAPAKVKEKSHDDLEHVVSMFEEAGAGNVDVYIDRAHRICKTYFEKKSSKHSIKFFDI